MFKCFLTIYFFGQFLYFSQRLKSILYHIFYCLHSIFLVFNYSFLVICYSFILINDAPLLPHTPLWRLRYKSLPAEKRSWPEWCLQVSQERPWACVSE